MSPELWTLCPQPFFMQGRCHLLVDLALSNQCALSFLYQPLDLTWCSNYYLLFTFFLIVKCIKDSLTLFSHLPFFQVILLSIWPLYWSYCLRCHGWQSLANSVVFSPLNSFHCGPPHCLQNQLAFALHILCSNMFVHLTPTRICKIL